MDPEAVMNLATKMADVAERVRGLETRLTGGLAATEWVGPDRERFENEWAALHVVALRLAAEVLDDASRLASEQARDQDHASA
ncbi:hypothetical protein ABFT23_13470 [Nocardioides sp. C4-1]|uniref:hypothetical protein n=1 Tax=Nocardioides sp. C4-1 TaxID=3151851 RepID=UPI003265DB5E